MRYGYRFLIVIFFIFHLDAVAQDLILYSDTQQKSFEYSLESKSSTEISTYFIEIIAKGVPCNADIVNYSAQFNVVSKVIKYPKNQYRFQLLMDSFSPEGLYSYRGFAMDKTVFPKQLKGELKWKDQNSGDIFSESFDVYLNDLYSHFIIWSKDIKDHTGESSFVIDSYTLQFDFDKEQVKEFDLLISDIDRYFDSGFQFDEIEEKLNRIQLDKVSMLMIYNIQLKGIAQEIEKMNPSNFYQEKQHQTFDPAGLAKRHDVLKRKLDSLQKGVKMKMETLDKAYYAQGMQSLLKQDTSNAFKLFTRSIVINPNYSPSHYQLAEIYLHDGALDTSVFYIRNILLNLKPDYQTKKKTIALASVCAEEISDKALLLSQQEAFNDAVEYLKVALLLCDSTPFVKCNEKVNEVMSKAKYGLYHSYLSVAEVALNHNIKMVETYLDLAYGFHLSNTEYIPSSAEVDTLYVRLLNKYQSKAKEFLSNGEYGYAMTYTDKAMGLCKRLKHLECDPESGEIKVHALAKVYNKMLQKTSTAWNANEILMADMYSEDALAFQKANSEYVEQSAATQKLYRQIKLGVYNYHVNRVGNFVSEQRFDKAIESYKTAKEMEERFHIEENSLLRKGMEELMVPLMLSDLKFPNTKDWGKDYKQALLMLDDVKLRKAKYDIENDRLQKAIDETQYFISITSCSDLSKEYKNEIRRANLQLQNGDYLNASTYWQRSINIARENPYCKLDTVGLLRYFDNYKDVIRFQGIKKSAEYSYQQQRYSNAIEGYWKAQKLVDSIPMKSYRIYHISFSSWVEGKISDDDFMDSLLGELSKENEYAKALGFWKKRILSKGLDSLTEYHKDFLKKMAEKDANNSNTKLSDSIKKHFNDDERFDRLAQYYSYYFLQFRDKSLTSHYFRIRYKIK